MSRRIRPQVVDNLPGKRAALDVVLFGLSDAKGVRLEQGTFSWPKGTEGTSPKLSLSPEALGLLTDGVDLRDAKLRPWNQRD